MFQHITEHITATIAADNPGREELDTILIKVASRCNINCTYCYVYNMGDDNWTRLSKFISPETIDAISKAFEDLVAYQGRIFSTVLHGGEPLLLGPTRLEYLLKSLRAVLPNEYPVSLQTNGILISSEILDICLKYSTTVAISIDGPEHTNDKSRVGHNGEGTYAKILQGIKTLRDHKGVKFLNTGYLGVIDPTSDPREVYQFFKSIEAPSVDFLYRDGNYSHLPIGKSQIGSVEYGEWMIGLLDTYLADEHPIPIRIIDDMLKAILGGTVTKEGMGVTDFGILIIDTDGTLMKNDTLKSTFNGADKFLQAENISTGNLIEFINSDQFKEYKRSQRPSCSHCLQCDKLKVCGGGMTLHRWSEENNFDNPSVYCADQMLLIDTMQERLIKILEKNG